MGDHNDGGSTRPTAAAHNDVSGRVYGSVVQAGSITGGVNITTGPAPRQRRWSARGPRSGPSDLDAWAEGLAEGVRTLWEREEEQRRVHDPVALPVRWHPVGELADHPANIRRLQAGDTGEPLALAGRIEQLSEIYRSVISGRLVILGPAGAGKTVLAGRLALDLLDKHRPGRRVPVVVNAGTWDPTTRSLNLWLAEQLTRDHPGLAARTERGGPTRARALVEAGRVLPILDGFDEIHTGLHKDALRALNAAPDTPMVITSRTPEFAAAVHEVDVLTAAAVVEVDELTVEDLAGYLPRTVAGRRTGVWDPVLEKMNTAPHEPGPAALRRVLTNPLMVFLARTIYSDNPRQEPAELLDTNRFPTGTALQDHLLEEFLPAVYHSGRPDHPPRWPEDRARHYLTHLADHLRKAGTVDLAWWQLRDTIPRWKRTLILAVVDALLVTLALGLTYERTEAVPSFFTADGDVQGQVRVLAIGAMDGLLAMLSSGVAVALTAGLGRWLHNRRLRRPALALGVGLGTAVASGLSFTVVSTLVGDGRGGWWVDAVAAQLTAGLLGDLPGGLRVGLTLGLTAGLVAGLVGLRSVGPQPAGTRMQIRGRVRFISGRFMAGMLVGLLLGLANGFVSGIFGLGKGAAAMAADGLSFGKTDVLEDAFVILSGVGLVFALVAALAFGLEAPAHPADVVGAAESLARDRRNAIRKGLVVGLAVGPLVAAAYSLPYGLAAAVLAGFVSVRATSAWMHWLVLVRGWLPVAGHLPWRVQAFLTDAYHRGVLRQTGAVYQFRHARLQQNLLITRHKTLSPNATTQQSHPR
ncbi:NACHT domain-containing protein [Streptomyces noursei]|uniref:NACHT domain-containing protein n=1 Tax=Streptomyces noursei TaxID=1971 RepID=UPI00099DA5A5|nr:NACHT domain-containing protein [Streptomyces noursei]